MKITRILTLGTHALLALSLSFHSSIAQEDLKGWHLLDPSEGKHGVSAEKALELLKDRKPSKVRVAIIDSGVDTDHEDLKANLWVNKREIAGNGIDDDRNGYVDDIHGWNFMGNEKGDNLIHANLELTRIYRNLLPKYRSVKTPKELPKEDREEFKRFVEVLNKIKEERESASDQMAQIAPVMQLIQVADSVAKAALGENYTLEDVVAWEAQGSDVMVKGMLAGMMQDPNMNIPGLKRYHKYLLSKLEYHYNADFIDRAVIGDDPDKVAERHYGNNMVWVEQADHGTHVAGIVGAVRGNGLGIDGVCPDVELMILRAVPDGDEFDKDIANAIRYAADNGAHIINMSFGKGYSPQTAAVHEAIRHAELKGVLMVHAAGNDSKNNDVTPNFPHPRYSFQKEPCSTWITVGASGPEAGEDFLGGFTNYGRKHVDIFSPGVNIWSAKPGSTYEFESGTSMAAPVLTGVAAIIKSYFPQITAVQLKQLLLSTARTFPKQKVNVPDPEYRKAKTATLDKLSVTGGVVNAYDAAKRALEMFP